MRNRKIRPEESDLLGPRIMRPDHEEVTYVPKHINPVFEIDNRAHEIAKMLEDEIEEIKTRFQKINHNKDKNVYE